MRKPIITVSKGEIGKILKHQKHALLVEPKPYVLAKAIEKLLRDKNLANKLSQNAYLLVKEKFDLKRIVSETIKILNKLQ